MDFKDESNQNHLINIIDSNHDSDIESRLYAEIYFTNTIEGDDNLVNSLTNNAMINSIKYGSNNPKDINTFISYEKNINQFTQIQSNNVNNKNNNVTETVFKDLKRNLECNNTIHKSEDSSVQTKMNLNKTLQTNQNMNISKHSNTIRKSNKRSLNDNLSNKTIKSSNKKLKDIDKIDNNIKIKTEENRSNFLINNTIDPTINCLKYEVNNLQKDTKVINPCANNSQSYIQLLSPEFFNLFFGKKLKKNKLEIERLENLRKKLKNKKSKKKFISTSTINQTCKQNHILQNNISKKNDEINLQRNKIIEKISNNKFHQTNTETTINIEQNLLSSEIIDISSESSGDSIENNSKYNRNVATDKKLEEKESAFRNRNSEDSTSDSEESIFEVPVPRKPTPPLIELRDSDNENDNYSLFRDSLISQENKTQNKEKISLHSLINSTSDICNINSEITKMDDLVLNCTQISNINSNLNKINSLNQLSSIRESMKDTTIEQNVVQAENSFNMSTCTITNSVTEQNNSHNSAINEQVISSKKGTNTLNNKQKNKSYISRHNIPMEEYFFQPMTNEMKSFYNKSWGGEHFDMNKLKSKMSTDPNKWTVLDNDIQISFSQSKRYFGLVCNLCEKPGHRQNQCPKPYKSPICHMCGGKGHFETSCNQKKCLTCGKKLNMYRKTCENCRKMFCSRCSSQGHMSNTCPDLWRRYHQTIDNFNAKVPTNLNSVMKPQNVLYCCNCARKGHDSVNCKKFRWSQHFPNPSHVSDYGGPDYFLEQFDLFRSTSNIQTDLINSRILNSSDNIDFTSDDLEILNTCNEYSNFHSSKESKKVQVKQNLSTNNIIDSNKNIFLKIKSKNFVEKQTLSNFTLKTNISDEMVSNNLENWNVLFRFLDISGLNMPIDFSFKQDNRNIEINMVCPRRYIKLFKDLINQFMYRTDFEKSCMYMTWDRNPNTILSNLASKITEMYNITECPLQLYDQEKELYVTLMHEKDQFKNDLRYSLMLNRLALCQQKLLMVLYREGFGNNSFKQLKTIYIKLTNKNQIFPPNKNGVQKSEQNVSFKCLFEYLYNYNNVFVPYEPKNLPEIIKKYKQFNEISNRVRNDPLLFPPEQNILITCNQQNRIVINETNNEVGLCDNYVLPLSSSQIPSCSQVNTTMTTEKPQKLPRTSVPQMPLLEFIHSSVNNIPVNDKTFLTTDFKSAQNQITNVENPMKKKKIKRTPNDLYKLSLKCKSKKKRIKFENKFKKFITDTKMLITEANKLNAPHLENHIVDLEMKMKNEIYLYNSDVKPLKKLVQLELKRQTEACKESLTPKKFVKKCKNE